MIMAIEKERIFRWMIELLENYSVIVWKNWFIVVVKKCLSFSNKIILIYYSVIINKNYFNVASEFVYYLT